MSSDGQTPLGVVAPGDPVPGPPNPEWDTFLTQVKAIEKKDSNMTSAQQIDRLRKPGSKYLNLNPFYVLQVDPEATEEENKKQYKRLSILLHPDKNPDNRDLASTAFESVSRAYKLLQEKETSDKFKLIIEDAKNRIIKMMEDKRKEATCKGLPPPVEDPSKFSHLVNVMASKQLADYEIRRDGKDKKEQAEKKRESDAAEESAKRLKKLEEDKKKWEDSREERVTTWKDFKMKGEKKKKKSKHMLGTFKPPKPRLEERDEKN